MDATTRRLYRRFLTSLVIAIVALTTFARSPRIGNYRTVDILLLFASGAVVGAAIVQLLVGLRLRKLQ